MAGYGNRTAPDYNASTLGDQHRNTRLGLTDSHSTPSYATGYGNKHASQLGIPSSSSSSASASPDAAPSTAPNAEPTRFDTQSAHGSAPYSNAHTYGSASTAGAGWGNKTGRFSGEGEGGDDSTLGRLVQRVARMVHSPGLERRGQGIRGEVREEGERDGKRAPTAN